MDAHFVRFAMVRRLMLIAGAGLAGIAGCSGAGSEMREVDAYLQQHKATVSRDGEAYGVSPSITPEQPTSAQPTPDHPSAGQSAGGEGADARPERLRGFIVLALERNPSIRAAEQEARSKLERIRQVTSLPDPFVNMKVLPEPVRTAEGDNFFILGISQKLPVPEKLDRAGRLAMEATRMALEKWQARRLQVIADVKRAYYQLYIVDRSIDVTVANQDLVRSLIDVARSQVAVGRRGQDDALRAQVELSNLEAEVIALRQRRISLVARLNELLDRAPQTEIKTPEDFSIRDVSVSLEALLAKAVERNPELGRLRHQIARDREAVELADLAYWPDFSIGFEWISMEPRDAFRPPPNLRTGVRPVTSKMSEDGSDNWAITFGFSLPIWFDKIEGGVEEARRRLAASRDQYRAATNRVEFAVEDAFERVESQQALARLFRDTIIPQAEQTYRVSQASYTAGTSDFLYVVDNWRKWLVFTIQYYRSLGELERSVADLEQAIGLSLPDVGEPS